MADSVVSNAELLLNLSLMRARFNGFSRVRLFRNNFTPDPTVTIPSFIEATFAGYAPTMLSPAWSAPVIAQLGLAEMAAPKVTYPSPVGGPANLVYGWWIDDGINVLLAARFAGPLSVGPGSAAFSVAPVYRLWARSVLPPSA